MQNLIYIRLFRDHGALFVLTFPCPLHHNKASPASPPYQHTLPPCPTNALLLHFSQLTSRFQSSASSGKFAGLTNQKRNSIDATAAARKASFDDQKPATGFIGNMWNRYVH